MATIRVSTELPISAETAYELAKKPALFEYVVRGVFRVTGIPAPDSFEPRPGMELSVRLWFFGFLPAWRHSGRLIKVEPFEICTHEQGGPVTKWNHSLIFEPLDENRCRYTDEVEVEGRPFTLPIWLFAHAMYRYRQMRWRGLARVLA